MFSYKANAICMTGMAMSAGAGVATSHNWNRVQNPDSSLIMHDFDLTDELSLKIELHMLRPITEKVHSGNGRVSLVVRKSHTSEIRTAHPYLKKKVECPPRKIKSLFTFLNLLHRKVQQSSVSANCMVLKKMLVF